MLLASLLDLHLVGLAEVGFAEVADALETRGGRFLRWKQRLCDSTQQRRISAASVRIPLADKNSPFPKKTWKQPVRRGIGIHHAGAELEPAKGVSGVKR